MDFCAKHNYTDELSSSIAYVGSFELMRNGKLQTRRQVLQTASTETFIDSCSMPGDSEALAMLKYIRFFYTYIH